MAVIKTFMNGVEMKDIYHNGSRLDEMYMNGVIVYKRQLELTLPQFTKTFDLRAYINSKNVNGADVIVITNNLIQPRMNSGNLSGLEVTLINSSTGEFQGTVPSDTGMYLTSPIKIVNNGWIRGAGGNGGRGKNGSTGAKGADGAGKTITYLGELKTISGNHIIYNGQGKLSSNHYTIHKGSWGGWSVAIALDPAADWKYTITSKGPCSDVVARSGTIGSNGGSWTDKICGAEVSSFISFRFLPVAVGIITLPNGLKYRLGGGSKWIAGGTGGAGGDGGAGGAGGTGQHFGHAATTGSGGTNGEGGSGGSTNSWVGPDGKRYYGNKGDDGATGNKGGTGGTGGAWGTAGKRLGIGGVQGDAAGKAIIGWSYATNDSKQGNISKVVS